MKSNGYTIKWKHEQDPPNIPNTQFTLCSIYKDSYNHDDPLCIGVATLSEKDQYDKNIGRKVSLSKAMVKGSIPKDIRYAIWEDYRNMTPTPRW